MSPSAIANTGSLMLSLRLVILESFSLGRPTMTGVSWSGLGGCGLTGADRDRTRPSASHSIPVKNLEDMGGDEMRNGRSGAE
jgi:hypothetical protein